VSNFTASRNLINFCN